MRHLLGRDRAGEQGKTPAWLPIPYSLVPFFCGSFAGVTYVPSLPPYSSRLLRWLPGRGC